METQPWERRKLGRTALYVTPLGIGGAYLGRGEGGNDERVAIDTVLRGLQLGINLIDTSPAYIHGESERFIGLALQSWYAGGGKRGDLVISTKTGTRDPPRRDYSYDGTMRSIETSQAMLQTDYLDIAHIHDPITLDPVLAPHGALDALVTLHEQGVVRAIGLGCRPHAFHQRCIATGKTDVSLTFRDYNLLYQTAGEGVLGPATAAGVGVLNATVTVNGLLSDREPAQVAAGQRGSWPSHVRAAKEVQRAQRLWRWCREREVSLLALNLQYSLREPRIASTLIGFSRPARVDQDVTACLAPIPEDTWDALHAAFGL